MSIRFDFRQVIIGKAVIPAVRRETWEGRNFYSIIVSFHDLIIIAHG